MANRQNIRARHLLLDAGISGADIARRLGITRQAVADVISGRRSNPRIRKAIADACGVTVESLWGASMVDKYATSSDSATARGAA